MPTITSRVHPGTVSSVLRLVADWTAGIWDLSSLAFTIPTGLAGRRTTTLSSFPAFRTCYGSPCLSAQGQSRDLQHLSPMLARCGNIALRDIAHMGICPVQSNVPHVVASFPSDARAVPGGIGSFYTGWQTATSLQSSIGPGKLPGEARSSLIGRAVWRNKSFPGSAVHAGLSLPALGPKGLNK
jgi:hypothetical protein